MRVDGAQVESSLVVVVVNAFVNAEGFTASSLLGRHKHHKLAFTPC
jgi:hypothetical protein